MAQLRDTVIAGNLGVSNKIYTKDEELTGNILGNQTNALGTAANPFHNIVLGGAASATMTDASTNPRITFQEGIATTQQVHLIYTDYDSYRNPAGLKVIGTSANGKVWFEVDGDIYARYIYPTQIARGGSGTSWVQGRDPAILKMTSVSGYSPIISVKSTNGSWEMGTYDYGSEVNKLFFTYITDANYNSLNNATTAQIQFQPNGYIWASGFTGNGSGLTSLNGSNISSGTVAAARIASLDASKIGSGTLPVGRGGTGITSWLTSTVLWQGYKEAAGVENLNDHITNYRYIGCYFWASSSDTNYVKVFVMFPGILNWGSNSDSRLTITTSSHYRHIYFPATNQVGFVVGDSKSYIIPCEIRGYR